MRVVVPMGLEAMWSKQGAFSEPASNDYGYLGHSLKSEAVEGPVLKMGMAQVKERITGWKLMFMRSDRDKAPMAVRLSLCNHPALPASVDEQHKSQIKQAYETKLGTKEHTLRDYSDLQGEGRSDSEIAFGGKGYRRALNRCFLWQGDPPVMLPMELVSYSKSEGASIATIQGEQTSMLYRGVVHQRNGVDTSDVFGGFPISYSYPSMPLADLAYDLRSIWPEVIDEVIVKVDGVTIADLSSKKPPDDGASTFTPFESGESERAAQGGVLPQGHDRLPVTSFVEEAVKAQGGRVRLQWHTDEAGNQSLAWLMRNAVKCDVVIVVNGTEVRVIGDPDIGEDYTGRRVVPALVLSFLGVCVGYPLFMGVLERIGLVGPPV